MNNNSNGQGFIFIFLAIILLFLLFACFGVFSFNKSYTVNENFELNKNLNSNYFEVNNIGKIVPLNPVHVPHETLKTALLEHHDFCAEFDKKKSQ